MTDRYPDTPPVQNICVYCGSGKGIHPHHAETARRLGKSIAERGIGLVYGGGGLGLMGEIATSALDHGGYVTGIIPDFLLEREKIHTRVQRLIITKDMHERKQLMFEKSDGFVALPGGLGTLDELVEQLTWAQLGLHSKPIVLGNIDHYWEPFLELIEHMRQHHYIRQGLEVHFHLVDDVDDIVPTFLAHATAHPQAEVDHFIEV